MNDQISYLFPHGFSARTARADWLYENREALDLCGYRLDLVNQAQAKMNRVGRTSILLEWSHNEALMLDRMFERLYKRGG